jgi:hypothetical protein
VCSLLLVVGLGAGCDREAPSGEPDAGQQEEASSTDVDTGTDADEGVDKRSAYGLPFPPKVRGVGRYDSAVEVTTEMDLEQLAEFYKTRLVDYEILQPDDERLKVVGLRKFMAEIEGQRYGPVTTLRYYPGRQKVGGPDAGASEQPDATSVAGRGESGGSSVGGGLGGGGSIDREPGSPVELKTPDGDLLAPGARWGEPYTPPEGSPLDQPRFEANFGQPFGEWEAP